MCSKCEGVVIKKVWVIWFFLLLKYPKEISQRVWEFRVIVFGLPFFFRILMGIIGLIYIFGFTRILAKDFSFELKLLEKFFFC